MSLSFLILNEPSLAYSCSIFEIVQYTFCCCENWSKTLYLSIKISSPVKNNWLNSLTYWNETMSSLFNTIPYVKLSVKPRWIYAIKVYALPAYLKLWSINVFCILTIQIWNYLLKFFSFKIFNNITWLFFIKNIFSIYFIYFHKKPC
jgi:hypothetical protein